MKLSKHRIFISGGAGVIGKELVKILYHEGAKLFIGDLKKKPKSFKDDIIYRQGDLNYIKDEELIEFDPDIFIHLAATFERTAEKKDFFEKNFWHNLKLSNKLLGILYKKKNIKQIIFASSYLVYNDKYYTSKEVKDTPYTLNENSEIFPRNLVGMAKLCHEIEIDFLKKFKRKKSNFISVRIFRGYGKGSKDIISRWVRSLLNKEEIYIFNPENMFDFIYSKDTAKGIFHLINSNYQGAINLGSGKSSKILEVLKNLRKKFPTMKTKYITNNMKYEASEADIGLLKKTTGWKPKYKIEKGISEIIDYEKNNLKFSSSYKAATFLLTSSSSKYPLINCLENSIKKIDANIEILLGDNNNNIVSRHHYLKFLKMPTTIEKNKHKILDYCVKNNVKYVLPTRDAELEFWSKNIYFFKKNKVNVFVSSINYIKLCRDKFKFSQFCKKNRFNIISSYLQIDKINAKKIVVKERFGSGSKQIGINLSRKKALIFSKNLNQPIFQEYITGKEISIDVWISELNEIKGMILRFRNLVVDGESKISTTFENAKIEKITEKFVKKFKFKGFICIQGIIKNENEFKIIECNPRIGGASTLGIQKGLDGIYWSILEADGQKLKNYKFLKDKRKIKLIRYQKDKYIYGNNF